MSANGEAAALGGVEDARPSVFEQNQFHGNPPAPPAQERVKCANCTWFKPYVLKTAPHLGECRRHACDVAFYLDGDAVVAVRYFAEDHSCSDFHDRREYASKCRGRAT